MNWLDFKKRRNLDEKLWLQSKNISSKEQFLDWCKQNKVQPPQDNYLNSLFVSKELELIQVIESKTEDVYSEGYLEKDIASSEDELEIDRPRKGRKPKKIEQEEM